ncbi:MAG: pilZ domain protein [Sphingomonas bacterium]|uniref:PilZ domain-containing protein n=1 Tax=Sphingomonas bacterium TaxID=1895847 RepID=UPI00263373D0|nr:PilZ domain-containing protein [Sphingomonas bacterium]MDB5696304.1 pilZ domain protein [Sphingomonas bacterium]
MIDDNMAQVARARPRRKLFQPAELDVGGGRRRVHVLDLSETGAQVNGVNPPALGSFVSLCVGEVRRAARVAWVRGQRFGVTFVMPLTANEVGAVLVIGTRAG